MTSRIDQLHGSFIVTGNFGHAPEGLKITHFQRHDTPGNVPRAVIRIQAMFLRLPAASDTRTCKREKDL